MSVKSWIIPFLSTGIGLGFVVFSFISGSDVNQTHVQLLDYILVLALGSGAIGASNAGFKKYQDFKNKKTGVISSTNTT